MNRAQARSRAWKGAGDLVQGELEGAEIRQTAQRLGERAGERVPFEIQELEVGEVAQGRRQGPREAVVAQGQADDGRAVLVALPALPGALGPHASEPGGAVEQLLRPAGALVE